MDSMGHGSMSGMGGGGGAPVSNTSATTMMQHPKKMMMHMTFFWGKNTEILFAGWPGSSTGMYFLSLLFIFFLAFVAEGLSHSQFVKPSGGKLSSMGLVQTLVHTIRVGLGYLVMLAVMSFNGGVFLAAVGGHALGFLVFGSTVFKKCQPLANTDDAVLLSL